MHFGALMSVEGIKIQLVIKRDGELNNLANFRGLEIPEKVMFKQNAF